MTGWGVDRRGEVWFNGGMEALPIDWLSPLAPPPASLCADCQAMWRNWGQYKGPASGVGDSGKHGVSLAVTIAKTIREQHQLTYDICKRNHWT